LPLRLERSEAPEAVRQVLYLVNMKASELWTLPVPRWSAALNHLAIVAPDGCPGDSPTIYAENAGFYPASADTSEKAHLGSKGVSCQNEGSTARSSSVRRST